MVQAPDVAGQVSRPGGPVTGSPRPIYVTYHVNDKRKDVICHVVANAKAVGVPDCMGWIPGLPETGTYGQGSGVGELPRLCELCVIARQVTFAGRRGRAGGRSAGTMPHRAAYDRLNVPTCRSDRVPGRD